MSKNKIKKGDISIDIAWFFLIIQIIGILGSLYYEEKYGDYYRQPVVLFNNLKATVQ